MAGKISEMTILTSISRTADYFEVYDVSANATRRTSVSSMLGGMTGVPVGTTDVQTLTNKTLTTPTMSSPTLSGTVAGTYTLGGTPTFPASVVTLTGSQTLTNKTLTSPTINTPTITNPTLTTDTVSEFTSAAGVTIDGLLIKDGTIPDSLITPAKLFAGTGSSWVPTSFTPTTTGWLGTPTTMGKYIQIGKWMYVQMYISGTSNATTATVTNMPATHRNTTNADVIALYRAIDNGSAAANPGSAYFAVNTTTVNLYPTTAHGNWTASGTKTIQGLLIIYEVA